MDEVKIGDTVLTASGMKQVYAFVHRTPHNFSPMQNAFLRIETESSKAIELTENHMIYVNQESNPVSAGQVKVGDYLSLMEHDNSMAKPSKVISITTAGSNGAYSPVTEDGTIVVNGIVASSFVNPKDATSGFVGVAGVDSIHRATFLQWIITPVRLYCMHVDSSLCEVDMSAEARFPFIETAEKIEKATKAAGVDRILLLIVSLFAMPFAVTEQTSAWLIPTLALLVLQVIPGSLHL